MTTITFTSGHCAVCGDPISEGMFCTSCLRPDTNKTPPQGHLHHISYDDQLQNLKYLTSFDQNLVGNSNWESELHEFLEPTTASNLEVGKIGYIASSDLFENENILWILTDTQVVFVSDSYHDVAIRKTKTGAIEAEYRNIDQSEICYDNDEEPSSPSMIVHLVPSFN